jgi:hypothetical protein
VEARAVRAPRRNDDPHCKCILREPRSTPFCNAISTKLVEKLFYFSELATPAGIEPATFSLEGCCSIR